MQPFLCLEKIENQVIFSVEICPTNQSPLENQARQVNTSYRLKISVLAPHKLGPPSLTLVQIQRSSQHLNYSHMLILL